MDREVTRTLIIITEHGRSQSVELLLPTWRECLVAAMVICPMALLATSPLALEIDAYPPRFDMLVILTAV